MSIIDLTHTITEDILVFPNTLPPRFTPHNTFETDGFFELKMEMVGHTGTHMDAPCHMIPHSGSLDTFDIERFMGKGLVIHCTDKERIDSLFLKAFEEEIAKAEFLLFYTGWQNKWNTADYFEGYPVLTPDASRWLTEFSLKGVGVDTISVDGMTAKGLPNHQILLGKKILIIENLTGLNLLPESMFMFHAAPLKVKGLDGSPVRAYAVV